MSEGGRPSPKRSKRSRTSLGRSRGSGIWVPVPPAAARGLEPARSARRPLCSPAEPCGANDKPLASSPSDCGPGLPTPQLSRFCPKVGPPQTFPSSECLEGQAWAKDRDGWHRQEEKLSKEGSLWTSHLLTSTDRLPCDPLGDPTRRLYLREHPNQTPIHRQFQGASLRHGLTKPALCCNVVGASASPAMAKERKCSRARAPGERALEREASAIKYVRLKSGMRPRRIRPTKLHAPNRLPVWHWSEVFESQLWPHIRQVDLRTITKTGLP